MIHGRINIFSLITVFALALAAGGLTHAEEQGRRNVEIEWEGVEGATGYEVQVTGINAAETGKKPMRFKTPTPKWSANVKPGVYNMQVRSFDERGVPGDWSPPSELQVKLSTVIRTAPKAAGVISAKEVDQQSIDLTWEAVAGADHYQLAVHSTTSEWKGDQELKENHIALTLPVGQAFVWNVTAVEANGRLGESNPDDTAFEIKGPPLAKPTIERPLSKYLREIKWQATPLAKSYTYELDYRDPKTKKWQKIESHDNYPDTVVKLDISRPSGRYRMKVQSFGERREPSKTARLDFDTYGGFRDADEFDKALKRDSLAKPTNFYLITSYLVTQVKYQGVNHDQNASSSFQATGGTGRVGLGYQPDESKWGAFGIADLSGFIIHGQNFKFASVEGHLTRRLELGQGGLLLLGAGVFSKELPIVSGTATQGFQGVGVVRTYGPHLGFTYWTPLTDRFGLQANARAYYSILGSTESSGATDPALSYQYGLLGSYRLTKTLMGFAGLAIRKDAANYKSNSADPDSAAQPGESNSIRIDGTYLNLVLEYSF